MKRFQKILYVSQGINDETDGLKQAISLARNNGAGLTALAITPPLPANMEDYRNRFENAIVEDMRTVLVDTARSLNITEDELTYSIRAEQDKVPVIKIIRTILQEGHDLVIKETDGQHEAKGFQALDMGLLRKCPCPVWLCRPITKARQEMKVAVAIDPESEEKAARSLSTQMLEMAASLAGTCSGRLRIIACWNYEYEEFLRHNPWAPVPDEKIRDAVYHSKTSHLAALEELVDQAGLAEDQYQIEHEKGRPGELIPQFVQAHDIDILVMGTVARTGIPGLTIGNTAETILQKLPCSLLALKPHGFVSPVKAYE